MAFSPLECVIVDDSLFIREQLSSIIREGGHNVLATYDNGNKLLAQIQYMTIDVIFLDIILPEITGLELLKIIKEQKPEINIIMLSGIAQSDAVSAALRLGAIDFLPKPIARDRLGNLLLKLSDRFEIPSVEQLSTIGVACHILNEFLDELMAHAASTLRHVINHQITSILQSKSDDSKGMLIIDIEKHKISPHPELWGNFTEEETLASLAQIPKDLNFELQFLYSEEFVENLINQAIITLSSKKRVVNLFEMVSPKIIGLPDLPELLDPENLELTMAGTSYDEINRAISLAVLTIDDIGPQVIINLNDSLLTEVELMRNSIFFYSLMGQGDAFQEGLFGPLPVTSEVKVSSMVYAVSLENETILICIYYTLKAEKIVADYNRISFLIKTRLTNITKVHEIDRVILKRMLDDIIQYLLEN